MNYFRTQHNVFLTFNILNDILINQQSKKKGNILRALIKFNTRLIIIYILPVETINYSNSFKVSLFILS